jgi:exopolyphosphatase/guanosine-5'-triphosphate,3'-diphosphate pyrophosphatase
MKIAAIDLGTNSFLCLVADISGQYPSSSLKVIEDVSRVVRLGEKVHQNRFFLPEALARAKTALTEFSQIISKHGVDMVVATATSAARDVDNGEELMKMGRNLGIPIFIIGGPKEAELSFEGAVSAIKNHRDKKILVVDVGGGSTELIFREPAHQLKAESYDVGCVRLTEMFFENEIVSEQDYWKLKDYGAKVLSKFGSVEPDVIVAVAGTPTTLACVEQAIAFDEDKVEGHILTLQSISELSSKLRKMTLNDRKKLPGLEPLRADVIVAGCALLECALEVANSSELRVSTRGLRYGVALRNGEIQ